MSHDVDEVAEFQAIQSDPKWVERELDISQLVVADDVRQVLNVATCKNMAKAVSIQRMGHSACGMMCGSIIVSEKFQTTSPATCSASKGINTTLHKQQTSHRRPNFYPSRTGKIFPYDWRVL